MAQFSPLKTDKFEKLAGEIAVAADHCSDAQLLDLADRLHAALRQRRDRRYSSRALAADGAVYAH